MTINNLKIPEERLRRICEKYLVKELAVFGSALRGDFKADSDIDLLYIFYDDAEQSLFSKVRIKEELEKLFGRPVDLISRRAIENSRNTYKRKAILEHIKVIYAA
jgi:predicted nucleotidyltransferase